MIAAVHISPDGLTAVYLLSAACFILALKALSSPKNARYGNLVGVAGMVVAVALTFLVQDPGHDWVIGAGMGLGAIVAVPTARLVPMTGMPQLVAIFNGVGGGAAAVISLTEYLHDLPTGVPTQKGVEVLFALAVGCISFSGSALAFAKLQEIMTGRPVLYPGQQVVNAVLAAGVVALGVIIVVTPHLLAIVLLAFVALALGAGVVLPVGGADTPVLISLLNSFTGLAVAADGFVLDNVILVVAGTLVGASGGLLTKMMSDAMGRSLPNIVLGGFGAAPAGAADTGPAGEGRSVRSGDATDIGTLLAYSRKVMIVPGYGLAVAQAQHVAVELARALEGRGVEVAYAIHPVAGRMPGHMNVLLAEADAPYEDLKEMEQANDEFPSTDVALVVGANDVVNPAARDNPGSPIYGMPILNVDSASNVVFLKRSLRPGFSGVDNALLYDPRTILLFGDAKDSLTKLLAAVKAA
ncbi:MAG TPA: NAD(P)(+) transhydrogenase (Re/Si-specific) subunit beta [Acidimicrobiales bacterium]|nr:NAD(P)(+) transhydrogenase (Re/Si-specific) subunit beta [Acidimicrobiales bacterium]